MILNDRVVVNTRHPGEWTIVDAPVVNTACTVMRMGTANVRHIVRSISFSLANEGAAKSALARFELLLGAITVRVWRMITPAGDVRTVDVAGLNLKGEVGESVTLRSTAAAGADTYLTVNCSGYSIEEPEGFERTLTP